MKRTAASAAALLLVTCAFYWKLTLTNQYEWMTGEDLGVQVYGWFQSEAEQWKAGNFPLWDQRLWNGQPTAGQAQPGALYPLNWFVFASPLHDGKLQRGYLRFYRVLIHFFALACCFALCRDLGLSRAASLLAAGAFAFDGVMGTAGWPQWVNGASWAPAVFLFLLRAIRGERRWFSAAASGACLGVSFLSGHHQIPLFLAVAWGLVWLWNLRVTGLLAPAVSLAFAAMMAAPQILPGIEFGRLSLRWLGNAPPLAWGDVVPYGVHEAFSYPPVYLFSLVIPSPPSHVDPHMGAIAVTLALLGIAMAWRRFAVPMLALTALTGCAIAFGGWSLIQGILYALLPGFEKARNPATAMVLVNFALAVLAGFGLDAITQHRESVWPRRASNALCVLGAAIVLALMFIKRPEVLEQSGITAAVAFVAAALLHAMRAGSVGASHGTAILVLLAFLEFSNSLGVLLVPRSNLALDKWLNEMQGHNDLAGYLKAQPERFRVEIADPDFAKNWGSARGIDTWGGYIPAVTRNVAANENHLPQTKSLWGVSFTISKQEPGANQKEVMRSPDGYRLLYNEGAFPRVWIAYRLVQLPGEAAIRDFVRTRHVELADTAITTGSHALPIEPCPGASTVKVESHRGSEIEIRAKMACNGLVVISETFYPGWRGYVDGQRSPILEVNGGMRAIFVPKGEHRVEMRFRPKSVYIGAGAAGIALLGLLLLRRR